VHGPGNHSRAARNRVDRFLNKR